MKKNQIFENIMSRTSVRSFTGINKEKVWISRRIINNM